MVATSSQARRGGNGFTAEVSVADARRQLRLSVGVVAMLSVCIVSAAATVGSHPTSARRDVMSMAPVVVQHAEANPVGAKAI